MLPTTDRPLPFGLGYARIDLDYWWSRIKLIFILEAFVLSLMHVSMSTYFIIFVSVQHAFGVEDLRIADHWICYHWGLFWPVEFFLLFEQSSAEIFGWWDDDGVDSVGLSVGGEHGAVMSGIILIGDTLIKVGLIVLCELHGLIQQRRWISHRIRYYFWFIILHLFLISFGHLPFHFRSSIFFSTILSPIFLILLLLLFFFSLLRCFISPIRLRIKRLLIWFSLPFLHFHKPFFFF